MPTSLSLFSGIDLFTALVSGWTLYSFFFTIALCAPFIPAILLASYTMHKKPFSLRLAMQMATPFFWLSVCAYAIPLLYAIGMGKNYDPLWFVVLQTPFLVGVFACSLAFPLLLALLAAKKQQWRQQAGIYATLYSITACLGSLLLPLAVVCAVAAFFPHPSFIQSFRVDPPAAVEAYAMGLLDSTTVTYTIWGIAYMASLGLALAFCMTATWLIIRRHRDDFGRDYYIYAMKLATRWAAIGSGCAAALLLIVPYLIEKAVPELLPMFATSFTLIYCACACTIAAAILWICIAVNANPMRLKVAHILALILLVTGVLVQGAIFLPRM